MLANILPEEASHSSLEIFETPSILVSFEGSFDQQVGPLFTLDSPTLEFKIVGDRYNFIDLQKIFLQVEVSIHRATGANLVYHDDEVTVTTENTDLPVFVNNALHSLFSDVDVYANGVKISSSNGMYAHRAFVETEISHTDDAKRTWLECQGYNFETNPADSKHADIRGREVMTRKSKTINFIGRLAVDFFACEKLLIPNVPLRIKLIKSHNDFVTISEDVNKHYLVKIHDAQLFVRKLTVTENVFNSVEAELLKGPAIYPFVEVIPRSFIITHGVYTWKQENLFANEPIRRFAMAMNTNTAFGNSNTSNPFHYRKFGLRQITVYRNSIPVCGTPLNTTDDKRLFLQTLSSLSFGLNSNGLKLSQFENHYVLVFDLTSTQEASSDNLHPELTNATISVKLEFNNPLTEAIEVMFIGEKASTIYIDKDRNVTKNALVGV